MLNLYLGGIPTLSCVRRPILTETTIIHCLLLPRVRIKIAFSKLIHALAVPTLAKLCCKPKLPQKHFKLFASVYARKVPIHVFFAVIFQCSGSSIKPLVSMFTAGNQARVPNGIQCNTIYMYCPCYSKQKQLRL